MHVAKDVRQFIKDTAWVDIETTLFLVDRRGLLVDYYMLDESIVFIGVPGLLCRFYSGFVGKSS